MVRTKSLDEIVKEIINLIEKNREEIYSIAEAAETELRRLEKEVAQVREQAAAVIAAVDDLQKKEKKARVWLAHVSANFEEFSERDIKAAYENAQRHQYELATLRAEEIMLRARRDEMERSLARLRDTGRRADRLASRVAVVLEYLKTDLLEAADRLEEMQQWQKTALRILEAQEEERRRVAREIHDGPAQSMANVVMRAEFCLQLLEQEPAKLRGELATLVDLVRGSLKESRKIIFDLRPLDLDDLGLAAALKRLVADYRERYGLPVEYELAGMTKRLPQAVEVALFRIVQEGLSNIYKHAGASRAFVKLEILQDRVSVLVQDNGCGFDVDGVFREAMRKGYGLIGIRERVQLVGGELRIQSSPGKGTSLNVSIDLPVD
ncbi:MAG TPA: histidine kinase [Desulfotomaculum sp.]|nr:histidine kinase [Desulfotomaculum sp.]